jgi:hypothetical protein
LYNGGIGLDKGMVGYRNNSKDNFWKRLPIERMQITDEVTSEEKQKILILNWPKLRQPKRFKSIL